MFDVAVLRGAIEHARKYNMPKVGYYYLQGTVYVTVHETPVFNLDDDTYHATVGTNMLGDANNNPYFSYATHDSDVNELEALLNAANCDKIHVVMRYNYEIVIDGKDYDLARITCFGSPEGGTFASVDDETAKITWQVSRNQPMIKRD